MTLSSFPLFPGTDNTALDAMFYDVEALSKDERAALSKPDKAEGMVLEVGPSWEPSVRIWKRVADCEGLADHYKAITVAGVGSSAVGAAALARNVADAVGGKTLAVVSGQGLADIASEAMGGFFLFGGVNAMRHGANAFDQMMDAMRAFNPWWPVAGTPSVDPGDTFQLANFSGDVKALVELLASGIECDWLVGHSKGNLVISEALYALRAEGEEHFIARAPNLKVVTFGARIAMPRQVETVIDVMGDLDSFGALNSRPDIAVDVAVPGAWHHTNTRLPFHVPVTKVLEGIVAKGAGTNQA